mmetsp:Transcript_24614/g.29704  ORF Transcript_24614/g.29704 Transcript_24614/m.29704 type:complete len:234 (+) Transcript_24614:736-1437(+)
MRRHRVIPFPVTSTPSKLSTITTKLLVRADGSACTVANAMERHDDDRRRSRLNPFLRTLRPAPFKITRFLDDNPRVFKSVPIKLPPSWPKDLNYSARSSDGRVTLEALPSDTRGNLCALLLIKPTDELALPDASISSVRGFDRRRDDGGRGAEEGFRPAVVSFRGAAVARGTVVLGDAAHTVKPYYGLGANTALEVSMRRRGRVVVGMRMGRVWCLARWSCFRKVVLRIGRRW